ncbi:MAG: hypothetical protein ACE5MK_05355 [Acidobacteriota bacterium]
MWNPNGKELFYRSDDKMVAVAVQADDELVLGHPEVLFERRFARRTSLSFNTYDVSPDGQRFIVLDDSEAEPPATRLVLVQNFHEELKRLVPTGE